MKVTNIHYFSIEELEQELKITSLDTKKVVLQIFSGFITEEEVQLIQKIIKDKNSELLFIGTTTSGEIYEGEIYEKSINISIMQFEKTTFKNAYFHGNDDYTIGEEIAHSLFVEDTKAAILFTDAIETNTNDIIDGISSVDSSVVLAGGIAGDNGYFNKTLIFDQNGVYSKGCVVLCLNSEDLEVFTQYQLNWQAIGKMMSVTKVEKNRLYEIDGINVSAIYTKYLGEKIGSKLPFSATEFPLLKIEKNGQEVCRAITHKYDDGSLATVGNLEVGDKVRFAFGNVDLIVNNTKEAIDSYNFQPEALYIYSCAARKAFLQSEITAELQPFNNIASNIGFFTYGEIYHHKGVNTLLSTSMSILAMSENEHKPLPKQGKSNRHNAKTFLENKHYLILEALTNLSNTVISELEEAKQQLKEQANRDYLTGLYNRRFFNEIAQDLILISRREQKPFSVVMLDIDRFKSINDTYGHSVGDDVIKTLSNTIIETVRASDIVSRYGGEEFALLLPFTDIDGAYEIAHKIRKNVESKKISIYDGHIIQFTVSLGVDAILPTDINIEQALTRADNALYLAKKSGRNRVVANSNN